MKITKNIEYSGIMVFCEQRGGSLMPEAFEVISEGRRLADECGCTLTGVILGNGISSLASQIGGYGADRVIVCDAPELEPYTTEAYTNVLHAIIQKEKTAIFINIASALG